MLKLTQAPNLFLATIWADMLNADGIDAHVQRQYLSGASGQVPPDQCLPEVWIRHANQEPRARDVLYHLQHIRQHTWFCPCGELVEGGFEQCWSCGLLMPG
jgi:hypothetical protein